MRVCDRVAAGLCTLLMRPGRLIRSAIVLKPSTLLTQAHLFFQLAVKSVTSDQKLKFLPRGIEHLRAP
jgi:hypothetical protein